MSQRSPGNIYFILKSRPSYFGFTGVVSSDLILALLVWFVPLPLSTSPTTRHMMVTAEQFAFNPPVLRVNRGDRVRLTLQAADVTHGFYLDS